MTTIILRNGTVFDGSGREPTIGDVTIRDGRIIGNGSEADEVIDCTGKWIMPGFVDIHTHYDAEVLLAPHLTESARHGVTTVVRSAGSSGSPTPARTSATWRFTTSRCISCNSRNAA